MQRRVKHVFLILVAGFLVAGTTHVMRAEATSTSDLQAQIDSNNQQVQQLNAEIARYETELKKVGADKKTLQAAIHSLDLKRKSVEAHIAADQHTINTTQLQIQQLNTGIASTSVQIATEQAALSRDFRKLQQMDGQPLVAQVLGSKDIAQFWQDMNDLAQFNSSVQEGITTLKGKQNDLATAQQAMKIQNSTLVRQRDELRSQQTSLTQTKQTKDQLLAETKSKESTYQKLLKKAKAELASFSAFAQNAGGSGLLAHQTSCDKWGCYYNQRDVAWGNDSLNGTKYALKSDGCLVTALAMVMTHYGYKDVTPVTINSNPGNFAAYYPAYMLFTAHIDGKKVTRVNTTIDKTLATGNPVIVGLHAYGGTHFVVLTSGSNGHYLMRDPYVPNAKDIPFSSHYRMSQIYAVEKVKIS